jgi:hypothetical protein
MHRLRSHRGRRLWFYRQARPMGEQKRERHRQDPEGDGFMRGIHGLFRRQLRLELFYLLHEFPIEDLAARLQSLEIGDGCLGLQIQA